MPSEARIPPGDEVRYASFWRRFAATMIDAIIVFAIYLIVFILFSAFESDRKDQIRSAEVMFTIPEEILLQVVFAFATICFWVFRQATPGKIAMSIRVVNARDGGKSGFGRLFIRYISYILSILPVGLGFFWMLWDERRQTWHDKLGGTLVVRDMRQRSETVRFG